MAVVVLRHPARSTTTWQRRSFGIFFFNVFIYAIMAQGWNLVAGYTGQISLSQNAFFGLGAYTMALLWFCNVTHTGYCFDPVLMILARHRAGDPRRS